MNSYWYAFGRRPGDAELRYWMSQPAGDPRLASPEALVANHLAWLRTAPSEQWETARRALREALKNVAGSDREAVVKNAVIDMMAGREGGGYRGLVAYLQKPGVRQYYVNLGQRATSEIIVSAYWHAFGRRPSDAELRYWMSQPASDPRLASTEALVANHLGWLRTAPSEQSETARRALREALKNVAGNETEAVVKNAVVDMMAGREGGGYRGLVAYLRKPGVRQYYVNLAQRATQPAAQPAPPKPPQPQVQAPKNIDDVGKLSRDLSPGEIQKIISLTGVSPITTSNPLIGNAGAGLIGNTGGALTQTTPLNNAAPLANVTPFTMPIGNNLSLPGGNAFHAQSMANPGQMVTDAFQMAFGRDPSADELRAWVEFKQKYPRSTVATSATNLAETLRYLLTLPAGEIQRQGMVRAAVPIVFRRAPTPNEVSAWGDRIRRDRMMFGDLVSAMRRDAESQSSPPQRGRRGGWRGVGG
ncbi:MAG: hypothetical protein HYU51_17950 [Candidatus Rokubacteria bacterium]|nr:hypothetical protein [Candidatus Rokubacteria bacterium]